MSGIVCQGQGRLDASGVPPSAWVDALRGSSEGGGRGRREKGGTEEGVSSLSASLGGPVVCQQEPEREGREVGCSAAGWHPVKQQGGSGHCGRQPFSPGTEAPLQQLRMERKGPL